MNITITRLGLFQISLALLLFSNAVVAQELRIDTSKRFAQKNTLPDSVGGATDVSIPEPLISETLISEPLISEPLIEDAQPIALGETQRIDQVQQQASIETVQQASIETAEPAAIQQEISEFQRDPTTGTLRVQVAQPEDILLAIWSAKEAVFAHIDICANYAPDAISDSNEMRESWIRKNRKATQNIEKYMRNYLEMNKSNFDEGVTVESRLAELTDRETKTVENTFLASPADKDIICNDLQRPLFEMTQDFRKLYRQNRKLVRTAFNEVGEIGDLGSRVSRN